MFVVFTLHLEGECHVSYPCLALDLLSHRNVVLINGNSNMTFPQTWKVDIALSSWR